MSIEIKIIVAVGNLIGGIVMLNLGHKVLGHLNLLMAGLGLIGILGVLAK